MLRTHFLRSQDKESGFTLVEILVVIVIIGLLAAIAIPIFMNQRQKANEASLVSDLRNAAMVYQSWNNGKDRNNAVFAEGAAPGTSLVVYHPSATLENNSSHWNKQEGFPEITVSEGNRLELIVLDQPRSSWIRGHQEGEICIAGANFNSSFDYEQGSGNASEYGRYLYYDSKLGGISTLDDLVSAWEAHEGENPEEAVSCVGSVVAYLNSLDT